MTSIPFSKEFAGPFASVCKRYGFHNGVRKGLQDALADGSAHFPGSERTFEFVGADENVHSMR
jgi:hypothetical protein